MVSILTAPANRRDKHVILEHLCNCTAVKAHVTVTQAAGAARPL